MGEEKWVMYVSKSTSGLMFLQVNIFYLTIVFSEAPSLTIIIIIIIVIISIFKEENVFSITASLTYGPTVNTDIDYYRTFFSGVFILQVMRG